MNIPRLFPLKKITKNFKKSNLNHFCALYSSLLPPSLFLLNSFSHPLHYRFKPGLPIHLHFLFLSILIQFSLHLYPLYIARTRRIQLYIYHFSFSVTHYSEGAEYIQVKKKMYKYISLIYNPSRRNINPFIHPFPLCG